MDEEAVVGTDTPAQQGVEATPVEMAQQGVEASVPRPKTQDELESERRSGFATALVGRPTSGDAKTKEAAKPMFFIDENAEIEIKLDILTSASDGKVLSVTKAGMGVDFAKDFAEFNHVELSFWFTRPNYIQLNEYRRRSTAPSPDGDAQILDRLRLREYFLVNHLKRWNVPGVTGEVVPLVFDDIGGVRVLSDSTVDMVHRLASSILDVMFTCYEGEVLLS